MWQVRLRWRSEGSYPKYSIFNFDDQFNNDYQSAQTAVAAFASQLTPVLSTKTLWRVEDVVRQLDPATGGLQAIEVSSLGFNDGGDDPSDVLADATQGLVRWHTEDVRAGRVVQGRTFIPGISLTNADDGNPSSAAVTAMQDAVDAMIASPNSQLLVWHRPVAGSGGSTHEVRNGTVWSEFAVLRKRRA